VPAVLVIIGLRYIPSVIGGGAAFTDWNGLDPDSNFVGLDNFIAIFTSPATRGAVWNTIWLAFLFVVLVNVIGLALALGLRSSLRSRNVLRAVFFLPFALSQLATAYIWQFIFAYDGPLNAVLGLVGIPARAWLAEPGLALYAVLIVMVWQYAGLAMVIFLAGLESISPEIDEAAAMDGARAWTRFRFITFPLLAPSLTISLSLTLIFGLGVFDQILAMTGGGPANATQTLATQVWEQSFVFGRFAQGSALALVLTVIVAVLALIQLLVLRRRENKVLA
jgi:raffinose/stachyose/melibiose transport system permease protein